MKDIITAATVDELASSVDATLANWHAAFESSSSLLFATKSSKAAATMTMGEGDGVISINGGGDGIVHHQSESEQPLPRSSSPRRRTRCFSTNNSHVGAANMTNDDTVNKSNKITLWKDSSAEYHKRLATFRSETYFAKPLALSPLVCAAFGWENTGKDIIKCRHPNCCGGGGAAVICITFHPNLNEESHNKLCTKYMDMLVSCHGSECPFRTYASRWSKAMKQCVTEEEQGFDISNELSDIHHDDVNSTKIKFYVPPYFLSISDEFLLFEDCTADGSITNDRIKEGAIKICDKVNSGKIQVDFSQMQVNVPDVVSDFCRGINPSVDLDDVINMNGETMRIPYMLTIFGWSISAESVDDSNDNSPAIVKCNMCLAKSRLEFPTPCLDGDENASRKRRRINAKFQLIDSHRTYCPFKSGFSVRPGVKSRLSGWKVVVSNMMKTTVA